MLQKIALFVGIVLSICLSAQAQSVKIENQWLQVEVDPTAGTFQVTDKASKRNIIPSGQWTAGAGTAKSGPLALPTLGNASAITVAHNDGSSDVIMLMQDLPFVLLRSTFKNALNDTVVHNKLKTVSFAIDLPDPSKLRVLGTAEKMAAPDKYPGSFVYMAVADPLTRKGVVAGWISHDRGDGILLSSIDQAKVRIDGQLDYGRLRIEPGKTADGEILAIGYFDDVRLGLESFASAMAKFYAIKLPPQPAGYCTWYSDKNGGASDEKHIIELANFAKEKLQPYGLNFIQIDDKWQIGERRIGPSKNFTGASPKGPYPGGMKVTADKLKELGFTPGIWFMPFAGDHMDPMYAEHQDFFVKTAAGAPFETAWGGTSMDMTNPGTREQLRSVVARIKNEWGYTYFKMDGLYTGIGAKQVYVNNGYNDKGKDDEFGNAVFSDPNKTNIEAFRDGLKLVRETAGKDVFILGCTIAQNLRSFGGSIGLVDAMRIGPDNNATWPNILRGPQYGTRRYFLHGRVWYNDPDPVYVRDSVPLNIAQMIASWAAVSGGLYTDSDWLPTVSPARIDILKRTIAPHGQTARPVDLLENDLARIWLVTDTSRSPRIDVVGLYNWETKATQISAAPEYIGLPKADSYVAYDYWADTFVAPFKDRLIASLPRQSCKILSVKPMLDRPQVVSTSRHVTQGMVDLLEQAWDNSSSTLSGKSTIVGNDPYELRIVALGAPGKIWAIDRSSVSEAGVKISSTQSNGLARVKIESPEGRRVSWSIHFTPQNATTSELAASDLKAQRQGMKAVQLAWQAKPADGVYYEVKRDDGPVLTTSKPQITDDNIEKGKNYTYTLTAMDWFGNRSSPMTAKVEIPAALDPGAAPPAPAVTLASLKPLESKLPGKLQMTTNEADQSIGLPAGSNITYAREPDAKRFVATVKIDAASDKAAAPVIAKVVADDGEAIPNLNTISETPVLTAADTPLWHINVELPDNCKKVHVVLDSDGDGPPAIVSWTNAGFVK